MSQPNSCACESPACGGASTGASAPRATAAENSCSCGPTWRRYPGLALLAALGTGLALSAAWNRARLGRWLGMRLVRQAGTRIGDHLWAEVRRFWAATPLPTQTAETTESDHDRP